MAEADREAQREIGKRYRLGVAKRLARIEAGLEKVAEVLAVRLDGERQKPQQKEKGQ